MPDRSMYHDINASLQDVYELGDSLALTQAEVTNLKNSGTGGGTTTTTDGVATSTVDFTTQVVQ